MRSDASAETVLRVGKHAIQHLLAAHPEMIQVLSLQQGNPRLNALAQQAQAAGVQVTLLSRDQLDALAKSAGFSGNRSTQAHQGVVAQVLLPHCQEDILPLLQAITHCKAEQRPLLLFALDSVSDPRNLGAILRVAEGAGAVGIVIPKHGSAKLSAVVAKTAAGADVFVPVYAVTNLARTLQQFKQAGAWVVAADGDAEQAVFYPQVDWPAQTVLLMGSEGEGIRRLVAEQADVFVKIPMAGQVSSLNVSVATGILAYAWRLARA